MCSMTLTTKFSRLNCIMAKFNCIKQSSVSTLLFSVVLMRWHSIFNSPDHEVVKVRYNDRAMFVMRYVPSKFELLTL
jgi:hypothetical protein